MSQEPSHPFIALVVKLLDEIYQLLAYDPGASVGAMLKLLHLCDPHTRTRDEWVKLEHDLRQTIKDRSSLKGEFPMDVENKRTAFDGLMLMTYADFLSRLNQIIWEAGYFYEKTFEGFYDPSGGRKSGTR